MDNNLFSRQLSCHRRFRVKSIDFSSLSPCVCVFTTVWMTCSLILICVHIFVGIFLFWEQYLYLFEVNVSRSSNVMLIISLGLVLLFTLNCHSLIFKCAYEISKAVCICPQWLQHDWKTKTLNMISLSGRISTDTHACFVLHLNHFSSRSLACYAIALVSFVSLNEWCNQERGREREWMRMPFKMNYIQ